MNTFSEIIPLVLVLKQAGFILVFDNLGSFKVWGSIFEIHLQLELIFPWRWLRIFVNIMCLNKIITQGRSPWNSFKTFIMKSKFYENCYKKFWLLQVDLISFWWEFGIYFTPSTTGLKRLIRSGRPGPCASLLCYLL